MRDHASRCLSAEELQSLLSPHDHPDTLLFQAHLESCQGCRQRLEQLAGDSQFEQRVARQLRESIQSRVGPQVALIAQANMPTVNLHADDSLDIQLRGVPAPLPALGDRLGNLELRSLLGEGGMGVVFLAQDSVLGRQVAVKFMSPQLAAEDNFRRRFLQEARAMAAIRSPHVVVIHSIDDYLGCPFLVMEHLPGGNLQQKLVAGPLPSEQILRFTRQIVAGLAAAHERGIIHRDVKPNNILLDLEATQIKLTDFGLARIVGDEQRTRHGWLIGTPAYMAPEQLLGDAVDHRADFFSLGSVIYSMATARQPVEGPNTLALLCNLAQGTRQPLAQLAPELPLRLVALVEWLHQRNPADRPSSTAEILSFLDSPTEPPADSDISPTEAPVYVTCDTPAAPVATKAAASPVAKPAPPIAPPVAHAPRSISASQVRLPVISSVSKRKQPVWIIPMIAITSGLVAILALVLLGSLAFQRERSPTTSSAKISTPAKPLPLSGRAPSVKVVAPTSSAKISSAQSPAAVTVIDAAGQTRCQTASLVEACEQAKSGDTIRISSETPLKIQPLRLGQRNLRIAGEPSRPARIEFTNITDDIPAFLETEGTLELEYIELTSPRSPGHVATNSTALVGARGTSIAMNHCRLSGATDTCCLRIASPQVKSVALNEVDLNSYGGVALQWWSDMEPVAALKDVSPTVPQLKLTRCNLAGETGVLLHCAQAEGCELRVSDSRFYGREAFRVHWHTMLPPPEGRDGPARLHIQSTNNIAKTDYLFAFWTAGNMLPKLRIRKGETIPTILRWNGQGNIYAPGIQYFVVAPSRANANEAPHVTCNSYEDWRALWLGHEKGGREATVQDEPRPVLNAW